MISWTIAAIGWLALCASIAFVGVTATICPMAGAMKGDSWTGIFTTCGTIGFVGLSLGSLVFLLCRYTNSKMSKVKPNG
jgi:heme/copper-type cytochrome/quinol oxidase subunit 2